MSKRAIKIAVAIYMLIFLSAVTWPGVILINRAEPLVFGLPFNLFFIAALIVGGLAMLAALYFSEQRNGKK